MTSSNTPHYSWQDLEGKVDPLVLQAPKTGGDPNGGWKPVHERVTRYLLRYVVGMPWADHLALAAAVLFARRRDVQTVEHAMTSLHLRFSALFAVLGLGTMDEWKVDLHLPAYLNGEAVPGDSQNTRDVFLKQYSSATQQVWNWLEALPEGEQRLYRKFALPTVNPLAYEALSHKKEIEKQQQERRKAETEAVVPHFAALRAEAHFRYNRVVRLRQAYRQALEQVLPDHSNLPLAFSYEEGDPPLERLHFKLWDRRSFVTDPEHAKQYHRETVGDARNGKNTFVDERNGVFLEFVKAERLDGDASPEGFWFTEVLKLGLLGRQEFTEGDVEGEAAQAWLRQWGYGDEAQEECSSPFDTQHKGLLSWSKWEKNTGSSTAQFINQAQKRTEGALIPVESLYAAATFGLLALDLLTTTGMRINELMQVNFLPECIVRFVDHPPPSAKDRNPRIRYALRLLPKGERMETRYNYGVGKETMRLIEKTGQMLLEHYHLRQDESLPRLNFNRLHGRSHRFEGEKVPYLFQYNQRHMDDRAITTCLRFLMHGMVFQTSLGEPVVLKAHLLRHAFATYAVQVEGLPIDLVAEWLKQKDLETAKYYSQIPPGWAADQHNSFVERLATQINMREAILRSPEEIQKMAEGAMKRVGMFVPTCGGDCTADFNCPNQFGCIHCPLKAPDPEKRYQVEEKLRYAEDRRAYYEQEGLVLEVEKMKALIRDCRLELKEMDLIVAYRKDESRAALIQVQPRPSRKQQ